jgi:hypothetical protein
MRVVAWLLLVPFVAAALPAQTFNGKTATEWVQDLGAAEQQNSPQRALAQGQPVADRQRRSRSQAARSFSASNQPVRSTTMPSGPTTSPRLGA